MKTIQKIFNIFKDKEIYLVGGSVRDFLLNKETNDLDFATKLRPEETKEVLLANGYPVHEIGIAFGTISTICDDAKVEITTYRKDEDYQKDNRKPRVEFGDSIEEDLKRRDFTINTLAMDKDGNIIDIFNGIADLELGILRTPIHPDKAFSDDPLRILRAIRFTSKYGFRHSEDLIKGLNDNAHKILTLSRERVLEEMSKILLGDYCYYALDDLRDYNILPYIFPEMIGLINLSQPEKYHFKDVWKHTLLTVQNVDKELILKWTMLFHDLGKYATFDIIDGDIHFYKHELVSKMMAEGIMLRMGFPNKWISDILFLIEEHMKPALYSSKWSTNAIRRFVNKMGNRLDYIFKISRADITSQKPIRVERHLALLEELIKRCNEAKNYVEVKCPVNGKELMQRFNIAPGPKLKLMKQSIIDAILDGKLPLDNDDKDIYYEYLLNEKIL